MTVAYFDQRGRLLMTVAITILVTALILPVPGLRAQTADSPDIEQLRDRLSEQPERNDLRYELARGLERDRQYEESERQYRQLVEQSPGNPDYRYGLSRVLFYQGRNRLALQQVREARDQAPDYEGLYRHEIRILQALNRMSKARELVRNARERFPDAQFEMPEAPRRWQVLWVSSFDDLSGNRSDWQSHGADVTRRGDEYDVTVGLRRVTRFDRYGQRYSVRVDDKRWESVRPFLEFQSSPDVKFLPDRHWRGGFGYAAGHGISLRLSADHRNYDDTESIGVQPGVTWYREWGHVGYTFYGSRLKLDTDRDAVAHSFFGRVNLRSDVDFEAGYTVGETVEAVDSNRVRRSDFDSYYLGLRYTALENGVLTLRYRAQDLDELYSRRGFHLSVQYGF
jgi:YaiO family outer membrane protein